MTTYSVELFSDLHKDVNGFRPRGHQFYEYSDPNNVNYNPKEAQAIWDYYIEELDFEILHQEKRLKISIQEYEDHIEELYQLGASDRETAIRWIIDEFPEYYDSDLIYYELNLSVEQKQEMDKVFINIFKEN